MFAGAKKLFMDILTEDDANSVFCPVRVIGASGAGAMILNAAYVAYTGHSFDPSAFGTGIATICGAVGIGAGLKAKLGA